MEDHSVLQIHFNDNLEPGTTLPPHLRPYKSADITATPAQLTKQASHTLPVLDNAAIASTLQGTNPIEPATLPGNTIKVVEDPDNPQSWKYIFSPNQLYGDNWLDQHQLVYAAYARNAVVDFAASVAGALNKRTEDLLLTGFESIRHIMRDALDKRAAVLNPAESSMPVIKAEPIGAKRETLDELRVLTEEVRQDGLLQNNVEQFFYNLESQELEHEYAMLRWNTLPYNLRKIYFKPELKKAVEAALYAVRQQSRTPDSVEDGVLFTDLITRRDRDDFVELVAGYLRKNIYRGSSYGRAKWQSEEIEKEINRLKYKFSRYALIPNLQRQMTGPNRTRQMRTIPRENIINPI